MGVYLRVDVPYTFTISWTEGSNMSSGWTYSDDAAGLTAGSTEFDKFFGYYGCRLNSSGQETAKVTQADSGGAGKLDITQLGTLTSGDNVMIAFPVMGIKMTKSGSTVTLSITKELNKTGYQYYAHCTGTISNPGTPKNAFYMGAYKGYNNSNVLKSWSGKAPTVSVSPTNFCTYANANGSGYNICGFYQRQYINALYMMKYGNPNSQSVVGIGHTGGGSLSDTGGTNSQTNATYGSSSNVQCKLFGVEDWWGNIHEFLGGVYIDNSRVLYTSLSGWTGALSGGTSTGVTVNGGGCVASVAGNNNGLLIHTSSSGTDYTKYYGDYCSTIASRLPEVGGFWNTGAQAGIFYTAFSDAATSTSTVTGARLMYL